MVLENDRTLAMAGALNRGNLTEAGELMQASHDSMRDDFEISSAALDAMVEAALASPDCYGARMTGGGFGGSCVALVGVDQVDSFVAETLDRYQALHRTAGRGDPYSPNGWHLIGVATAVARTLLLVERPDDTLSSLPATRRFAPDRRPSLSPRKAADHLRGVGPACESSRPRRH